MVGMVPNQLTLQRNPALIQTIDSASCQVIRISEVGCSVDGSLTSYGPDFHLWDIPFLN